MLKKIIMLFLSTFVIGIYFIACAYKESSIRVASEKFIAQIDSSIYLSSLKEGTSTVSPDIRRMAYVAQWVIINS